MIKLWYIIGILYKIPTVPHLQLVCALLAANVHVARAADDVEVPATAAVSGYGSTVDSEYCR